MTDDQVLAAFQRVTEVRFHDDPSLRGDLRARFGELPDEELLAAHHRAVAEEFGRYAEVRDSLRAFCARACTDVADVAFAHVDELVLPLGGVVDRELLAVEAERLRLEREAGDGVD